MLNSMLLSATMLLLASKPVYAFNCATHTFGSCEDKIVHWYDPDDGLICDPLDCGGGRAAPKTDVPGCANYKGTSTRAGSSYLSCFKTKELATSTKGVVTATATSTPPAITHTATSTAPAVDSTASASSSQSSSSSILPSTISESIGIVYSPSTTIASSTSPSTSTASPSTTSPPAISSAAVQNGTTVSSSGSLSTSSTTPNAGGKVSMDSIMVLGLGLVGAMALA